MVFESLLWRVERIRNFVQKYWKTKKIYRTNLHSSASFFKHMCFCGVILPIKSDLLAFYPLIFMRDNNTHRCPFYVCCWVLESCFEVCRPILFQTICFWHLVSWSRHLFRLVIRLITISKIVCTWDMVVSSLCR